MSFNTIVRRYRRSINKRYDRLRESLGYPPKPGWNRLYESGLRLWYADPTNDDLRYNYKLGTKDTVLDLGGYRGEWTDRIVSRYGSAAHVFEPVPSYYESIALRFESNPKVQAHCCGLAGAEGTIALSLEEDASSAWKQSSELVEGQLQSVERFFAETDLSEIALCKINIEGGEYELLECLLDTGLIDRFRNLQIQFHTFVPDAEARMAAIQDRLQATHKMTYHFPFVWENWQRRSATAVAA